MCVCSSGKVAIGMHGVTRQTNRNAPDKSIDASVLMASSVRLRGVFLAVYGLMQGLGVLACYCIGTALHCEHPPDQEAAAGEARHSEHDCPGRLHAGAGGRLLPQTV